jgi:hypothetical protein
MLPHSPCREINYRITLLPLGKKIVPYSGLDSRKPKTNCTRRGDDLYRKRMLLFAQRDGENGETNCTRRGDELHEKRRRTAREEETNCTRRGDELHEKRRRKLPKTAPILGILDLYY